MKHTSPAQRRAMRCGLLPRAAVVPPGWPYGESERADTCPGYSTSLPEVVDTAEAWPQWKERTLDAWLEEPPTRDTLHALAVLGNAIGGYERWRMEQDRRDREAR